MWNEIKTELGKPASLTAVLMMALFTFVFLGTEYLYVNMVSLSAGPSVSVNAQNYVLGISVGGFFAYPLLDRLIKKQYRTGFLFIASLIAVSCIFVIQQHISYLATLISGSMLFLLFGIFSGKVYDMSARALGENRCLARLVGISYAFGILLQFVNNNLINSELAEAIVLSGFLSMLVIFFMRAERARRNFSIPHKNLWQEAEAAPARIKGRLAAGILLALLVALMACVFSTLDNAVTLKHAAGTDIGQWPRLLLAGSGLAAGFLFDLKNRKFMVIMMYCVMIMSVMCIVLLRFGAPFLVGLFVFYLSSGFFVVFFTSSFMELSRYMRFPALWAGMGRTANNICAVLITNLSVSLLVSGHGFTAIIAALVLFVAVSIVMVAYMNRWSNIVKATAADSFETGGQKKCAEKFMETVSLTSREYEVFERLISTEESVQEMADALYMSRRTLQRYISLIYEKTGTKSRLGLYRLYIEFSGKP